MNRIEENNADKFHKSEDIRDMKTIEQSLMERESKYKSLFYNMTEGFAYTKIEYDENGFLIDMRFLEVNTAFEKIFKVESKNLIGKTYREIFPINYKFLVKRLQESVNIDKTFNNLFIDEINFEECMKWLSLSFFEAQPGYLAAIITDKTEKKISQMKLHSSLVKYQYLFMNMHSAVAYNKIIFDKDGKCIDFEYIQINDAYVKLSGLRRKDIIRRWHSQVFPKHAIELKKYIQVYENVAVHGININGIEFYSEISNKWYEVSIYSPEKYYFMMILTDITTRKNVEKNLLIAKEIAEEANISKSSFLANMSHEIRTPLNGVIGMLELTLLSELNYDQKENLTLAKSSANSLLKIISDILDFSKIEAGKLKLEKIKLNLYELVSNVIKVHSVIAENKGIKLELIWINEVPKYIKGDPVRLKQIIDNLLGNAIKFTDEGNVVLSIKKLESNKEICNIEFSIKDTGIGISEDEKKYLFKSFSQVDGSYTRKFGGTGLGLVISKQLIENMGGNIEVYSEKGKGSLFKFNCIFEKADNKIISLETGLSMPKPQRILNILLVEDDLANQMVINKMINNCGHKVTTVSNGEEVFKMIENYKYDIILMDIQMPVMNGIDTTKYIREKEKYSCEHQIIIAVTAYVLKGDREKFLEIGMDDYISKPIDIKELSKLLDKYSRHKSEELIFSSLRNDLAEATNDCKLVNKDLHEKIAEQIEYLKESIIKEDYAAIEKVSSDIINLCCNDIFIKIKQGAFQIRLLSRKKGLEEIKKNLNNIRNELYKINGLNNMEE